MIHFKSIILSAVLLATSPSMLLTQIDSLTSWIYMDSVYYYISGLAEQRNWFSVEPIEGVTVYLTNQVINCSDTPIHASEIGGAWVAIEFPSFEIRDYSEGQICVMMSYWGFGSYSNIESCWCSAGLTLVDTVEQKFLQGWVNIEMEVPWGELCKAHGSFDVQFCSSSPTFVRRDIFKLSQFKLNQNYPNPFNPVTMINYQLPMPSAVELSIYNLLGQKVATLVNERKGAGHHQVEWDASNMASGVYLYRLEAGNFIQTKKMILMR